MEVVYSARTRAKNAIKKTKAYKKANVARRAKLLKDARDVVDKK